MCFCSRMRSTCLCGIKSSGTEKTPSSQAPMCPTAPLNLRMPRSRPFLARAMRGAGSYAQRYPQVRVLKSAQCSCPSKRGQRSACSPGRLGKDVWSFPCKAALCFQRQHCLRLSEHMAAAQHVDDLKNKRRGTHKLAELLSRLQSKVCSFQAFRQYIAPEWSSWCSASQEKPGLSLAVKKWKVRCAVDSYGCLIQKGK